MFDIFTDHINSELDFDDAIKVQFRDGLIQFYM